MKLLLLVIVMMFILIQAAHAHEDPQKVVNGKYAVTLIPTPENGSMNLRFYFRDIQTGNSVLAPISFIVRIRDEKNGVFILTSGRINTSTGVGKYDYTFPPEGSYEVLLEFETADEPGKIYTPEDWSILVPAEGTGNSRNDNSLLLLVIIFIVLAAAALAYYK